MIGALITIIINGLAIAFLYDMTDCVWVIPVIMVVSIANFIDGVNRSE